MQSEDSVLIQLDAATSYGSDVNPSRSAPESAQMEAGSSALVPTESGIDWEFVWDEVL